MLRHPVFRRIAALVLGLLLLGPAVPSLWADSARAAYPLGPSLQPSWEFLVALWDSMTQAWNKNGCTIDPDGQKNGCSIDPDGLKANTSLDNGCTIDPSGQCTIEDNTPPPAENGCSIDPNGLCVRGW